MARSSGQTPGVEPTDARILDRLLNRAATTAAGTYILLDGALSPAPTPIPLVVQTDAFKGAGRTIRVAVALGGEVSQAVAARLVIVAASGTAGAAPRVVAEAVGSGEAGRLRLVREFTLRSGEYELHAAVGRSRAEGGVIAALAKTRLTVPDLWNDPLVVTPLVLADAVGAAQRTTETRAFHFGPTALSPATSNHFAQSGDLHVAFRVFNWHGEPGAKPDLTVEYLFYQQGARRLNFFNKLKPQRLSGDTLGEAFDPSAGVVTAGMTVPLQSFPHGEFELTVRVTDQRAKQSAERQVRFMVSP